MLDIVLSLKEQWVGRWAGQTVICVASGPSLTPEDCELCRLSGHQMIVTKMCFRLCPDAAVLWGMDSGFWAHFQKEIDAVFHGAKLTLSAQGARYGATSFYGQTWFRGFGNSGTCAISLAALAGASTVILLAYDCQRTGGKVHWHGDHPPGFGNGRSMKTWPAKFKAVGEYAKSKGCRVLNASRETALTCFERMDLEAALDTCRAVRAEIPQAASGRP